MNDQFLSDPLDSTLTSLDKAISEYKSIHPGYLSPEFIRQLAQNYKDYLLVLDQLNCEDALRYIELGRRFALELKESVKNSRAVADMMVIKLAFKKDPEMSNSDFLVLKKTIISADPKRFINEPPDEGRDLLKAKMDWYEFVQLNMHQLAKKYVQRSDRKFSKDEVLTKYQSERKKGLRVPQAHSNTMEWLESYGKSIDQIYEDIGIQLHDKESFNREYNRWKKKFRT